MELLNIVGKDVLVKGLLGVILVMSVVELSKAIMHSRAKDRFLPLVSVFFGVVIGLTIFPVDFSNIEAVAIHTSLGVILGATASGVFDLTKAIKKLFGEYSKIKEFDKLDALIDLRDKKDAENSLVIDNEDELTDEQPTYDQLELDLGIENTEEPVDTEFIYEP